MRQEGCIYEKSEFHFLNDEGNGTQSCSRQNGWRCGMLSGLTLCTNAYHSTAWMHEKERGDRRFGCLARVNLCANADLPRAVDVRGNGLRNGAGCWCFNIHVPTKVRCNTSNLTHGLEWNRAANEMRVMNGGGEGTDEGVMQRSGSRDNRRRSTQAVNNSTTQTSIVVTQHEHSPNDEVHAYLTCAARDGDGGMTKQLHQPNSTTWGPCPLTVPRHQPSPTTCVRDAAVDQCTPREAARSSVAQMTLIINASHQYVYNDTWVDDGMAGGSRDGLVDVTAPGSGVTEPTSTSISSPTVAR